MRYQDYSDRCCLWMNHFYVYIGDVLMSLAANKANQDVFRAVEVIKTINRLMMNSDTNTDVRQNHDQVIDKIG